MFKEWRDKIVSDDLNHHGGVKALLGHVLLDSMASLQENFENVKTAYMLIMGSEDKLCNIEGSKVKLNQMLTDWFSYLTLCTIIFSGVSQNVRKY